MTQKKLAEKSGVIETTIRKYELGIIKPKLDNLQKISNALGVQAYSLMDTQGARDFFHDCFWTVDLEEKLKQIGYSLGYDEDNASIWINYPDGCLEVTDSELRAINESAELFLRFQLNELKDKHKDRFYPAKS